ncbi:MAG TPA: glycosyltransferase family 4 protein [Dehalococcoidia bacterium]
MSQRAAGGRGGGTTPPHLLLVSTHYWPEETGNAPYVTDLAEHLARRGLRVTVLTGMPHYPRWQIFPAYRGALHLHQTVNGVAVRRFRQYVPARQTAARRALYEASFLVNALPHALTERPAAVLAVVPGLAGGVAAAAAAARWRAPLGLIFQDLVGNAAAQSGVPGGGPVSGVTRRLEAWTARRAAAVAVISDGFRPYLRRLGVPEGRMVTLRNWSRAGGPPGGRRPAREAERARLGWRQDQQVVLHAGNMGLKQGLEHLLAAARLAVGSRPHLRFVLMGDGSQRTALAAAAAGCPNVSFLDLQPEGRVAGVLDAADVLLVHERRSVVSMSLPSKLTAYFAAGRPVVAAVAPGSETAREVLRAGAGLLVPPEEPAALLAALDRLHADPALAEDLGARGRRYAATHLSRGRLLARAAEFVQGLYGGGRLPEAARSVERVS